MADDPMAEFLARERAALGEDADQFQADTPSPTSQAASDALQSAEFASPPASQSKSPEPSQTISQTVSQAMSPAVSQTMSQTMSPAPSASQFEQEWLGKHRELIDERDQQSETKHQEIIDEARQAIDKFYEEYNERKDRAIEENRASEEIEQQAAARGTLWERVVKQADMVAKASPAQQQLPARDTSRMRDLLQDLRRDPQAPGSKKPAATKA
ncbi:Clathrin light chain [Coemansia sp. RSA 2611]|nr:Clathrin light chain [Coemansia sp. RSA 2610]KAJ2387790.1 Clathrin light chain [Coemansia sp. RSA 2611]